MSTFHRSLPSNSVSPRINAAQLRFDQTYGWSHSEVEFWDRKNSYKTVTNWECYSSKIKNRVWMHAVYQTCIWILKLPPWSFRKEHLLFTVQFQLKLPYVSSKRYIQLEPLRAPSARLQVTSAWAYEYRPARSIVAPGPGILPVWVNS